MAMIPRGFIPRGSFLELAEKQSINAELSITFTRKHPDSNAHWIADQGLTDRLVKWPCNGLVLAGGITADAESASQSALVRATL